VLKVHSITKARVGSLHSWFKMVLLLFHHENALISSWRFHFCRAQQSETKRDRESASGTHPNFRARTEAKPPKSPIRRSTSSLQPCAQWFRRAPGCSKPSRWPRRAGLDAVAVARRGRGRLQVDDDRAAGDGDDGDGGGWSRRRLTTVMEASLARDD
jgi:hypothetical protein